MPMSAIKSLSRSVGLEMLADVPSPKEFIDENSMMGKAVNRDKPDAAQLRCSGRRQAGSLPGGSCGQPR